VGLSGLSIVRTAVFPGWLGWLGIVVAVLYLLGLAGSLWWRPIAALQGVAFFLFLTFVLLIGLLLLRT
jgi:hypothetical protein